MLAHALFGCCWHHAHAEADDASCAGHADVVVHEHAASHHQHQGNHGHDHESHQLEEPTFTHVHHERGTPHEHQRVPHSDEDLCDADQCSFVKENESVKLPRLALTGFVVLPADAVATSLEDHVSISARSARRLAERVMSDRALGVRAHLALQILLI